MQAEATAAPRTAHRTTRSDLVTAVCLLCLLCLLHLLHLLHLHTYYTTPTSSPRFRACAHEPHARRMHAARPRWGCSSTKPPRLPGYHPQVGLQLDNLRLDPSEEMRLGPAARAALNHTRDQWARGLPPSLPAVRASLRLGGHGYDVLEALLQRIDKPVGGAVGGGAGGSAGGSVGGGVGGAGGAGGAAESFAAAAAAVASLENWLIGQASKCSK